jgi:hypothetical protein
MWTGFNWLSFEPCEHGYATGLHKLWGICLDQGSQLFQLAYHYMQLNTFQCRSKLKLSHYTLQRRLGERRYRSYSFSASALDGVEWPASCPGLTLAPGERTPGTHCTGRWVGPRTGLDTEARTKILSPLPGIEPRSTGRPARSQTLYCLSYPAHQCRPTTNNYFMY